MKPLEIFNNLVKFFSDRDEDLMAFEVFALPKELGFRECELPTSEEHQ